MTSSATISPEKSLWLEETVKEAERYIEACQKDHKRCASYKATKFPTRVIDIGPPDGSKEPLLLVSNEQENPTKSTENPPGSSPAARGDQINTLEISISTMKLQTEEDCRYTALSYCWGKTQHFVTEIDTLKDRKEKIPWNDIPLTIQDAILITRGLKVRYLWVDALCIIQNSREDWAVESVKMAEIYGGAYLTISAALGADVHFGLMRIPTPKEDLNFAKRWPLQDDPLYSRAWALQERMLSPRVLIFGSHDRYWECYNSETKLSPIISYRFPEKPSVGDWHIAVTDYTCRNLTDERDKLPALAGLAKVYGQATGKDYICGLWKQNLVIDLLWKQQRLIVGNSADIDPPKSYRAPSWSWASLNGNCMFHGQLARGTKFKPRVEVIATFLGSSDNGSDKAVEGDEWLLLRGPLFRAKIVKGRMKLPRGGDCGPWMDLRYPEFLDESWDGPRTMAGKEQWNKTVTRDDTWCLFFGDREGEGFGLVLEEAVELGERHYRRVGTFVAYGWEDSFTDCEESDLLLI